MMRFRILIAFALLFATLLPSVAFGQATYTPPTAAQIADLSTCLLTQVAFCDTFNEGAASGSARSGALDESKWSVSHVTGLSSIGQGQVNEVFPSDYMHCMDPATGLLPPNDYFMCQMVDNAGMPMESMHFMEAFNDHGNYDYNSAMIRQPFDFANRTGTIAFDVDAKTDGGHMWWPEVWITQDPAPAPHQNTSPNSPRNGIGIEFANEGPSGTAISTDATGTGLGNVSLVTVVSNYQPTDLVPGKGVNLNGYYTTKPDSRNRFQVRISQDDVQVWATDFDGTNFREVADIPNLNLGFTRGYVAIQHADYNPEKYGVTGQQTYHWDNVGFDGPALPVDRGYSVPDALSPGHDAGSLNLAYILNSTGSHVCCGSVVTPLNVTGVDPAGAVEADLTLDVWDTVTTTLHVQVGSGPVHDIAFPPPTNPKYGTPVGMVIPIPLSEIAAGANTLHLSADSTTEVGNIDLVLRMSVPADAGTTTTSATSTSSAATTSPTTTSSVTSVATTTAQSDTSAATITQTVTQTVTATQTVTVTESSFALTCTEQGTAISCAGG